MQAFIIEIIIAEMSDYQTTLHNTALQSRKAITVYLKSKRLLPSGFALQNITS